MTTERGDLREGELIGGFEIERRIGSGGFGMVYLARDPRGTRVALKVLTPDAQDDPEVGARLMKEAMLLAEIEADNVVRFHAAGNDGGRIWLAMEYVPGGTLRDKLPKGRPIEVEQALRWARQIADGTAELHKVRDAAGRPVVHRDLKPENVLLTRDGLAKVADFGIAKFRTSLKSTSSNEAIGTPLYMAPEQMGGSAEIDERADVFALGVILYEMLSGKRPAEVGHDGELTLMEKVTRSLTQPVTPLQELNVDVPDYVSELAARALQKRPEDRFATMRDMEDALVGALKRFRRERGKKPSFAELTLPPETSPAGEARTDAPGQPGSTPRTAMAMATTDPAPHFGQGEPGSGDRLSTLAASSRSLRRGPARRRLTLPVIAGGMALGIGLGALVFRTWTATPAAVQPREQASGDPSPGAPPTAADAGAGSSAKVGPAAPPGPSVDPGAAAVSAEPSGTPEDVSAQDSPQPARALPDPAGNKGTGAAIVKPGPAPKKCVGIVCNPDL